MEWRPRPWLATLLSLLVVPVGMLYLQRPRLALLYLLASILLPVAAVGMLAFVDVSAAVALIVATWAVSIFGAVHAFRIGGAASATRRRWYSRWYGLISVVLLFYFGVLTFRSFCYEPFRLPSDAMFPTLTDGSFMFVKKWGYGDYGSMGVRFVRTEPTAEIKRGEIVLFRLSQKIGDVVYVKRVIGLPGDRVQCSGDRLIINDRPVPIASPESRGVYRFAVETLDGVSFPVAHLPARPAPGCDLVVPERHYFMLGDNRDNSRDSRHFGPIPSGQLVGRMAFAIRGKD